MNELDPDRETAGAVLALSHLIFRDKQKLYTSSMNR
jgi:hypothetical protein